MWGDRGADFFTSLRSVATADAVFRSGSPKNRRLETEEEGGISYLLDEEFEVAEPGQAGGEAPASHGQLTY